MNEWVCVPSPIHLKLWCQSRSQQAEIFQYIYINICERCYTGFLLLNEFPLRSPCWLVPQLLTLPWHTLGSSVPVSFHLSCLLIYWTILEQSSIDLCTVSLVPWYLTIWPGMLRWSIHVTVPTFWRHQFWQLFKSLWNIPNCVVLLHFKLCIWWRDEGLGSWRCKICLRKFENSKFVNAVYGYGCKTHLNNVQCPSNCVLHCKTIAFRGTLPDECYKW